MIDCTSSMADMRETDRNGEIRACVAAGELMCARAATHALMVTTMTLTPIDYGCMAAYALATVSSMTATVTPCAADQRSAR